MLVALLIAAALAAGQTPAPPEGGGAPTPDEIDALQQLYDSSCGSRGYGQYDDVCIQITQQLNEAKAAAEKAKTAKPKTPPRAPQAPPSSPSASTPTPAPTVGPPGS